MLVAVAKSKKIRIKAGRFPSKCRPKRCKLRRITISRRRLLLLSELLEAARERVRAGITGSPAEARDFREKFNRLVAFFRALCVKIPVRAALLELDLEITGSRDYSPLALSLALKDIFARIDAVIRGFEAPNQTIVQLLRIDQIIQIEINQTLEGLLGPQGPAGPQGPQGPEGTIPSEIQQQITILNSEVTEIRNELNNPVLQQFATIDGGFVGVIPNNQPIPFNMPPEISGTFISQTPPSPDIFLKGGQTYLINREIGNITASSAPVQFVLTLNDTEVPYSFTSAPQALGSSTGGTSIVTTPPGEPSVLRWVNRSGFNVDNLGATMTIVTIA